MENRTYKFFTGTPVYSFGHGLTYSDITENWLDDKTVEVENRGEVDNAYSVLRYEYIPHKNLCGFKKIFLKAGEKQTVCFGWRKNDADKSLHYFLHNELFRKWSFVG